MTKKLDIPFIKSRGFECGQACASMIVKFYYPDFEPDFDKINKIIHHTKNTYTFPPQLAILLNHFGVKSKVYSSDDIKRSDEDPKQFKRWFGDDYEYEMKSINLDSFNWMVDEMRKDKLFMLKKTKFNELLELFGKDYVVGIPIDWNTLINKNGSYEGHFVVISGIENNNILVHDPDIGSFQKYNIKLFEKAWEHPAIADDYLVAYSKK